MPADRIESDPRVDRVLFTEEQIRKRIEQLAHEIARDFADTEELRLIGVLKGAFVFLADLGRAIRRAGGPELRFDFIRASTYAAALKGTGETERPVELELVPDDVAGRTVLLVEDILDQGFTLARVKKALVDEHGARDVRLCVLLDKALDDPTPEVRLLRETLVPDYAGFRVPDRWVAGYGLDVAEDFRELPYVIVVREEHYADT